MTRDEWIASFAERAGVPRPSPREARELLELAGTAAHASERTAAPLACWIAGRAGIPLAQLLTVAERVGAERAGEEDGHDGSPASAPTP